MARPRPVLKPNRVEEEIASRYAAGDTIGDLALDYEISNERAERAVRKTMLFLFAWARATAPTPTTPPPSQQPPRG